MCEFCDDEVFSSPSLPHIFPLLFPYIPFYSILFPSILLYSLLFYSILEGHPGQDGFLHLVSGHSLRYVVLLLLLFNKPMLELAEHQFVGL